MKKLILFNCVFFICMFLLSQNTENRTTTKDNLPSAKFAVTKSGIDKITLNPLPQTVIDDIISQNTKDGTAYKVSESLPIDVTNFNSGTIDDLSDGATLWRLTIKSEAAKAVVLLFDWFDLPKNAEMYVYCKNTDIVFGPYTYENNPSGEEYAIGIIPDDEIFIEYYENKIFANDKKAAFKISSFDYFFRAEEMFSYLKKEDEYGNSGSCNVNINCPEGTNWKLQKKGVAKYYINNGICTGTLINNTSQDGTPYFLTADHCGGGISSSKFNSCLFFFNYESPACNNSYVAPLYSTTGCTRIARGNVSGGTDLLLLKLKVSESELKTKNIVYNGWDRSGKASPSGVCIHHPSGDNKKISTYTQTLTTATFPESAANKHWKAIWVQTTTNLGITEQGSSGSPLFNNNGLVIGTLSGGMSECGCSLYDRYDLYGKFSEHWNNSVNGSGDAYKLQPWLDPKNTGANTCPIYIPNNSDVSFSYDFESCADFAVDKFSPCSTYDGDKSASYGSDNFNFLNEGYIGSFIAFNSNSTNPSMVSNSNWQAHSGNKFGACFNVASESAATNDWFILPKIKISANSQFSFWAKSVTTQYGNEHFNVWISNTTNSPSSFNKISNGNYISVADTWTKFTYNLSEYKEQEVFLAIRCVSLNCFVFGIDDILVAGLSTDVITNEADFDINVYPNPNDGNFTIIAPINSEIRVFDIMGKIIESFKSKFEISNISLLLQKGIYFIEIQTNKGQKIEKIVIN